MPSGKGLTSMAKPNTADDLVSEKDLDRYVKDLAKVYGWSLYHQVDAVFCPTCRKPTFSKKDGPGFPDLVLAHPNGRLIFAELKSQKGPLREGQAEWLQLLAKGPAEVYIWRPSDMDTLAHILQPSYVVPPGPTLVLPAKFLSKMVRPTLLNGLKTA